MKLPDFIDKLIEIQNTTPYDMDVCVLIKSPTGPASHTGMPVKTVEVGDIGGWGNMTVYLEPFMGLELREDET